MDAHLIHDRTPRAREHAGRQPLYEKPHGNSGGLRNLLAPVTRLRAAWAEAACVTLAALALAWLGNRGDPLLLHSGFPWLWFAPTLIALRYGVAPGLGSSLLLALVWLAAYPADAPWPAPFFVGGSVLVILAGHFADTWNARAAHANAVNGYLDERLAALTGSHYLLRLSHERLERDLLARPATLRDSIGELRRLAAGDLAETQDIVRLRDGSGIARERDGASLKTAAAHELPGAAQLLEFVARACQIEVAALYPVRDGRLACDPPTAPAPLAAVGEPFELDAADPLVALALSSGELAHLKSADPHAENSRYIACAPLVSATGATRALLVVERMPFLSLNHDNLQLLFVLLGYYGDGLDYARATHAVMDAVPGCPHDFALEYARLARLHARSGVESSVVALSFPRGTAQDSLFEHVQRRGRAADLAWSLQNERRSVLVNLMPLADATGVAGYLARTEATLRNQFDTDFDRARIGVHTLHVTETACGKRLADFLRSVTKHA